MQKIRQDVINMQEKIYFKLTQWVIYYKIQKNRQDVINMHEKIYFKLAQWVIYYKIP